MKVRTLAQSIDVVDETPLPTEIRLFARGLNTTAKGVFLYDDKARETVFAEYQAHGVDIMIDLEHLSLDDACLSREDAQDARGYAQLEDRAGELWAVHIRWGADGARRLRERRQRYFSPAFATDLTDEQWGVGERDADAVALGVERVRRIVNIALCAMPATDHAPPLVAASHRATLRTTKTHARKLSTMTPEQTTAALDAVTAEDGAKALELLKTLLIEAATGGEGEAPEAPEALAEAPEAPPAKPAEDPAVKAALSTLSALRTACGAKSDDDLVAKLSATFREVGTLSERREALDSTERAQLVGRLVELRSETPATAWEDADKRMPCARLRGESLESLRDRVRALSVGATSFDPRPATRAAGTIAERVRALSADTLASIRKRGWTPEQYIENLDRNFRSEESSK